MSNGAAFAGVLLVACAIGAAAPCALSWLLGHPDLGGFAAVLMMAALILGPGCLLGYAWGNAAGGLIRVSMKRRDE